jgi:hypothetical protein
MNPTRTSFRRLQPALAGLAFLAATGCEPTKSLQTPETLFESSPAQREGKYGVQFITITTTDSSLATGEQTQATGVLYGWHDNLIAGPTVAWAISPANVATISSTGLITAGTTSGTATVYATADDVTRSMTITVDATSAATPSDPQVTTRPGAFYVSPNGSDSNPGTEAQPWRTLTSALPRLRAGQTLYLRGGTYSENVKNPAIQPGLPTSRITLAAYPGERPVLVGLLWLTRPSYWTLDGINVTWQAGNPSTSHMVKMTNGIGWVIENSELWGARSFANLLVYGSRAGEPANWVVRNNCIHDTYASNSGSQDQNMYVNSGTSAGAGLIERNLIFNAPNGMNVKLGYGSSTPSGNDGTANVTVRYNTMAGALKPLMVTEQSHDNVIERNLVVRGTDSYAIRAYRLTGANNVFRDNGFTSFSKLQYADAGYTSLTQGAGNSVQLDPKFDGTGCGTFKPSDATSQAFGRFAR